MQVVLDHAERFEIDLLRNEPDHGARLAVVALNVMSTDARRPRRRLGYAADRRDQRRLACPVRTEQGDDFSGFYIERYALEGFEPALIGFLQVTDLQDRSHCHPLPLCQFPQ